MMMVQPNVNLVNTLVQTVLETLLPVLLVPLLKTETLIVLVNPDSSIMTVVVFNVTINVEPVPTPQ